MCGLLYVKCYGLFCTNFLLLLILTQIKAAEFSCPFWFSPGATSLIQKIIDPNPQTVSALYFQP